MEQVTKNKRKNRFSEPSTWAGLAGIAAAVATIPAATPFAAPVAAIAGAVAVWLREGVNHGGE